MAHRLLSTLMLFLSVCHSSCFTSPGSSRLGKKVRVLLAAQTQTDDGAGVDEAVFDLILQRAIQTQMYYLIDLGDGKAVQSLLVMLQNDSPV